MSKIKDYVVKNNLSVLDKWIGTDGVNNGQTKNFSPLNLSHLYNTRELIRTSNSIRFFYDTVGFGENRSIGSFSFPTEVGATPAFSTITQLVFNEASTGSTYIVDYLQSMVGGRILIQQAENRNQFAFFKLTGLVPKPGEAGFHLASLEYITGNGNLAEDQEYLVSLIQYDAAVSGGQGSGTTGFITKWITNTEIGNSSLFDSPVGLGIFTSNPQTELDVNGVITATDGNSTQWNEAVSWGNHATQGYITSESDPIFTASAAFNISLAQITNWDEAHSWGNHATAGYLTELNESDPIFTASPAFNISLAQITNWDEAHTWGDHSVAGYLTQEVDTIDTVLGRGNTTTKEINVNAVGLLYANFNPNISPPEATAGRMYFDSTADTMAFFSTELESPTFIGEHLKTYIYNGTGATITKGSLLRKTGVNGTAITVVKAQADSRANLKDLVGFAAHDIEDATFGYSVTKGKLRDVNTLAFAAGSIIWASETVAGEYQITEPSLSVNLGSIVVSDATEGIIDIDIRKGVATEIADFISLSTNYESDDTETVGTFFWDDTNKTVTIVLENGVRLQLGQEMPVPCWNLTGVEIPDGTPVYTTGRQGKFPTVAPAQGDTEATARVYGLVTTTLGTSGDARRGYVTETGLVQGIKTNYTGTGIWGTTWNIGDRLWVSKDVPGQLTNVEPQATHYSDVIGSVAVVGSVGNGAIDVRIVRHDTLKGLSDINGTALDTTGQIVVWDQTNGFFDFDYNISPYQETVSTGVVFGGELTINALDNTLFDIAAGYGYIVNALVFPATVTPVSWNAMIGVSVTNLATSFATDIAIDVNGNVLQQNSYTDEEKRSVILLGGLDHSTQTSILSTFSIQIPVTSPASSLQEFARAIGDLNLAGNVYGPNGANLSLDKSGGRVFSYGRNNVNNKNAPHVITTDPVTLISFGEIFNDGAGNGVFTPPTTTIDPDFYDDGSGTLAAVPVNDYQIKRILFFPNDNKTFIQYGTATYNKLSDALNAVPRAFFEPLSGITTAVVRGYIIVREGETTLQSVDAEFIPANKFGIVSGLDAGGSQVQWGNITGNIDDQIDLSDKFDTKEDIANRGIADGYTPLDSNAKIPTQYLPNLAITSVIAAAETTLAAFAANSGAYTFEEGDVIVITTAGGDTEHYMYDGGTKTLLGSYSQINNTQIDWNQIVNTPTTISGYGITDAYTKTEIDNRVLDDLADVNFATSPSTTHDNVFITRIGFNNDDWTRVSSLNLDTVTADTIIKSGGLSTEFLKADGSVDNNTYITLSAADGKYLLNTTDVFEGALTFNKTSGNLETNWSVDGAGVDEKEWDFVFTTGGVLNWRAVNDANSAATNFMTVNRTGIVIDSIQLASTLVDINANLDVSGSGTFDTIDVTGGSLGIELRNQSWLNFYNGDNTDRIRFNHSTTAGQLDLYHQTGTDFATLKLKNLIATGSGTFDSYIDARTSTEGALIPSIFGGSHQGISFTSDANYQKTVVYGYIANNNPVFQVAGKPFTATPTAAWDETGSIYMTVRSSGNVSIGNTNDTYKLDVSGTGKFSDVLLVQANNQPNARININNTASSGNRTFSIIGGINSIGQDGLSIYDNVSAATRMVIDNAGKIGMGITAPASRLHVRQNDTATDGSAGITIEQDGTGDAVLQFLLNGIKRWVTGIDNSDGDKFKISENTELGTDTRFTIAQGGNVGIGTNVPDQDLHIYGGASGVAPFGLDAGLVIEGDTSSGINILTPINQDGRIYFGSPNGNIDGALEYKHKATTADGYMVLRAGNAERMRLTGSGNVLIGTTTDGGYKLDVNGSARMGNLDLTGDLQERTTRKWHYVFGGSVVEWETLAKVTIGQGVYRAANFIVKVTEPQTNFGASTDYRTETYYVSVARSGGTEDSLNTVIVNGKEKTTPTFKVVKVSDGNGGVSDMVVELQARMSSLYRNQTIEIIHTSNPSYLGSGSIDYYTGGLFTSVTPATGTDFLPTFDGGNFDTFQRIYAESLFVENSYSTAKRSGGINDTHLASFGNSATPNEFVFGGSTTGANTTIDNYVRIGANKKLQFTTTGTGAGTYDIFHTGNDGSGSGLDADTVDGLQASSFLRTDVSDTVGSVTTTFQGALAWSVSSIDTAHQRADARDTADEARLHWYGVNTVGTARPFKHAWYDGSSYVNIDVGGGEVIFDGIVRSTGELRTGVASSQNGSSAIYKSDGGVMNVAWEDNYYRYRRGGTGTILGWRWDNFDTVVATLTSAGDFSTTTVRGQTVIGQGSGNNFRSYGSGTGTANVSYMSFYESNGSVRQGYIGFGSGSNNDFLMVNDTTGDYLQLDTSGGLNGLQYSYGSGDKKVWHEGNQYGNLSGVAALHQSPGATSNTWIKVCQVVGAAFNTSTATFKIVGGSDYAGHITINLGIRWSNTGIFDAASDRTYAEVVEGSGYSQWGDLPTTNVKIVRTANYTAELWVKHNGSYGRPTIYEMARGNQGTWTYYQNFAPTTTTPTGLQELAGRYADSYARLLRVNKETGGIGSAYIFGTGHNGTASDGVLVLEQSGGQRMFIDGNDIDVFESGTTGGTLYLQDYSKAAIRTGGDIQVAGAIMRLAHDQGYLEGSYNNVGANQTRTNPIYIIGSGYKPAELTLSNMYGIGYSEATASFLNSTDLGTTPTSGSWGLYVAADGEARIFLDASNGVTRQKGVAYASNFTLNSDKRLKKKIKDYDPDNLNIRWRQFELKSEPDKFRVGVVAQELLKTNPEFVDAEDKTSLTVNNFDLLNAAMAQKDKQIKDLTERLEKLENLIEKLIDNGDS